MPFARFNISLCGLGNFTRRCVVRHFGSVHVQMAPKLFAGARHEELLLRKAALVLMSAAKGGRSSGAILDVTLLSFGRTLSVADA